MKVFPQKVNLGPLFSCGIEVGIVQITSFNSLDGLPPIIYRMN